MPPIEILTNSLEREHQEDAFNHVTSNSLEREHQELVFWMPYILYFSQ